MRVEQRSKYLLFEFGLKSLSVNAS